MMKMASIHNNVRRIISMLLICSCILGCRNKPRIVADDTDITFKVSELHDTNVYLTGVTEDKLVWFTVGVTECSTLDEELRSKGEERFKQEILDELSERYESIAEIYKKNNIRLNAKHPWINFIHSA